jgi:hypothetical protein
MLSAANATMMAIGAVAFAQFFLLTLYMQDVLHYSAIRTGVAFIAITASIAIFANFGQALTTRLGVRRVLTTGLLLTAAAGALETRLPVHGSYFADVFPPLVLGGIGLALSFVPVTIAALSGVEPADAGIASGLINTTRQVGGSLGLAAVTTIAATAGRNYLDTHAGLGQAAALGHGFQVAFYAVTGIALVGMLVSGTMLGPRQAAPAVEPVDDDAVVVLEEAA